jgi:hypothetical protein
LGKLVKNVKRYENYSRNFTGYRKVCDMMEIFKGGRTSADNARSEWL